MRKFFSRPITMDYNYYADYVLKHNRAEGNLYPCLLPNYDHSPRSAHRGVIITNSNPTNWGKLCRDVFEMTKIRPAEDNLVFIKAWNEWGEGNYLEPDLKFDRGYLEALKKAKEGITNSVTL